MKTLNFIIGSLLILLLSSSCSIRVMDFTMLSSKNVELTKFPTYERGNVRVEGEDTKPVIVFVPLGSPDGKEAMDRAIESTPGAVALLDGVLIYKYFYIPLIYGEYTYVIEGTPLIDPALADSETFENLDDHSVSVLSRKGEVTHSMQLGEDEYYALRDDILKSPRKTFRQIQK